MRRQLGLQLHTLDPTRLPLYDGITGELIPADMDSRVERVRDALLDAARERVDELGEAAVDGELRAVAYVRCADGKCYAAVYGNAW